jgi:hypothetical protein
MIFFYYKGPLLWSKFAQNFFYKISQLAYQLKALIELLQNMLF